MPVRHADDLPRDPVKAGSGTVRQVLIGPGEGPHFALRRFIMEPGGGMPLHTNTVEHEQYVLRGRATIRIGEETFQVGADDVVFIPAGV
ncbi:MAG TPA: cupin domain-containing protein, partial [Longimicrobiales bacterium]|nr:cupin domain-containing protein [Longimicrobiales bacterium]